MKKLNLNAIRLLGVMVLLFIALPISAQYTVSIQNKTISQAIKIIESTSDYRFFYADTLPGLNRKVSFSAANESIESILTKLLKGTHIVYQIQTEKQVVLSAKGASSPSVKKTGTNISQSASSTFTLTGQVVGTDGEPLVGVTVLSTDTKKGTTTDIDGNYTITLDRPQSLSFNYIGYEAKIVNVDKTKTLDITMSDNNIVLNDVVVVGYGTQKKANLTGAVQSVNSNDLMRRNVSTASAALQGMVPGLTAVQSSGQPGADNASLKIRGLGSLNSSTAPLILIDGVEGDMNRIDLNTVESITVLKDAASASIYGSRASNGVILVTTKRGAKGKVKVSFNGYAGFNTPTTLPEACNAIEYMQSVDVARVNANQEPLYPKTIEIYQNGGVDNIHYYDTDWRGLVIKDRGWQQNYSVGVSGGNDVISLYASAGYYKHEGLIDNNNFSRTTLRVNTDTKINKWAKLGIDVGIRQANVKSPVMATPTSIIGKALTMTPIMSGINADGTYGYGINGTNPIAMAQSGSTSNSTAPEYSVRATLTLTPFEGMNIFGAYIWKRNDSETNAFVTPYKVYENGVSMGEFPTYGSSKSEQRTKSITKQFNLQATYEKTFGNHYLKALLGFQSEEMNYSYLLAGRKNYNYEGYEELVNGDASTMSNSSAKYSWALLSYFFRVNYSFKDRYLLEVNGRYDGTSRFRPDQRWGFFPSVSAGWKISEESFFESAKDIVNNLKLRASYGELGNQAINGYYPYASSIGSLTDYGYWFDKELSTGVAQIQLANTLITWEKSKQFDIGLDGALFSNRLTFGFDYYIRNITNMLQQFPVPMFVGMTAPWKNAGSMRNKGWELNLGWQDRVGDVNYYIKANLSDVKNKVIDLYGKEYVGSTTITREGDQYNSWYGYIADGYFQTQEEINSSPIYGGNVNNVKCGYIKYRDISGADGTPDGKIDSYDRTILGNPTPRYEYGLTIGGDWKGFDLSIFFQGVGKKDVYYAGSGARALTGNYTIYKHQLDYWTADNTNATYPILLEDPNGTNPNNMISSFWVKSGAYCRLKNIVLGYSLPKNIVKKATMTNVRIYASAQNLLTIKNNFYKGFDPENSIGSGASCYPLNKTFIFGINVEF
ncbi:MAG: TonB-dependent receptor [Muribaculaceae bacterium]|nr:TonB-dependent receptor [Muribaculaceae bacterium]